MAEKISLSPSLVDDLNQFRSGKSGEGADGNWLVFGYEGRNHIISIATGSGGLNEEFRSNLFAVQNDTRYALYRRDWKVEMANTVKYILIDYTPDSIPPMRKALLSTHKAQIKEALKPFSVNFEISKPDEISEEIINDRLGETSGTANKTTTKAAQIYQTVDITRSTAKPSSNLVPDSVQANRPLNFTDEQAIRDAIRDVRDDKTQTNWCLIHYSNPTTLELVSSGEGGVEELISHLNESEVFYGFFRISEAYDHKTTNVKFCYLKLVSPNLPPMQKAKLTTQAGFVQSLFQPYHTDFDIQSVSDLNLEIVTDKIQRLQNTKQVVLTDEEKHARQGKQRDSQIHNIGPASVPLTVAGAALNFANEAEFKSGLQSVRSGSADYFLASVVGKDTLGVLSTGTGGVEALKQHLEENNINFGLVRVEDIIDKSVTVKFVYIKYQPETVAAMKKSSVSTKKGLYDQLFAPYHVNFEISSAAEIDEQSLMDKVQSASGSKSKVVEKK